MIAATGCPPGRPVDGQSSRLARHRLRPRDAAEAGPVRRGAGPRGADRLQLHASPLPAADRDRARRRLAPVGSASRRRSAWQSCWPPGCLASLTPAIQRATALAVPLAPDLRRPRRPGYPGAGRARSGRRGRRGGERGRSALLWRRARIALVAIGACLLAAAAPTVRLLLVEAYPTSYYRSPTGFAAASITAWGRNLCRQLRCLPRRRRSRRRPAGRPTADASRRPDRGASLGPQRRRAVLVGEQRPPSSDGTQVMPAFAPLLPEPTAGA